jgi:hypothetical protein
MWAILNRRIVTERRIWFWASTGAFIVLGLIDPDGYGDGKSNWPSLFGGFARVVVAVWRTPWYLGLDIDSLTFMVLLVAAFFFAAALIGWFLHVPVCMVWRLVRMNRDCAPSARTVVGQRPSRVVFAFAGAVATAFAGILTFFNGLQFWIWFWLYEAAVGENNWEARYFQIPVVMTLACLFNAGVTHSLHSLLTSAMRTKRLLGLVLLGGQMATLLVSTALWHVYDCH